MEKSKDTLVIRYKKYPKGRVALKYEATVDIPISILITLIQEPDRYTSWSPYCAGAKEVKW